jgi:tetratricopeptide (TPR) repeat protein
MKPASVSLAKQAEAFRPPTALQAQVKFQQARGLHQRGQLDRAFQAYLQVIQLQPRNFDVLHLAGVLSLQMGDAQRAVDLLTKALKVDRNSATAYNNRGTAYAQLGDYNFALLNYSKAIFLSENSGEAYNNRGNVLIRVNRCDEALIDFEKAIILNPSSFEAYNNRGNVLSEMRRYGEARASFERAVELNPQSSDAHWNLGQCCLRMGDFEPGWHHSERRLTHSRLLGWREDNYTGQRWSNSSQDIRGKTILLIAEQGLGDTIQFSRYAALVRDMGAQVILEVQSTLAQLLKQIPGIMVVARGTELPPYDLYCPLLSLPMVFKTNLHSIPAPEKMIFSDKLQVERWAKLLGDHRKPRVGIAWAGNILHADDYKRSMSIKTFSHILCDEVDWISLHKDIPEKDKTDLAAIRRIADFFDQQHDFGDLAAICEAVDLVISVDTSIAHLAATIGKPVWLLLAHNADWRWMNDRADSVWYPGVTLYRQDGHGDWSSLLQKVKVDLQAEFSCYLQ